MLFLKTAAAPVHPMLEGDPAPAVNEDSGAGRCPLLPPAPGGCASPTAPTLGWKPSPAWGTLTAMGECGHSHLGGMGVFSA